MKKILAIVLLAFMPLVYADHHAQKEPTTKRSTIKPRKKKKFARQSRFTRS
jgi:hypothetical protein